MAVFRIERTRDYTVMSNHHLRDKQLSLKAKGLLSQMLSLPEDWDYTLTGLAHINRESRDAIRSAINELERAGYIQRRQTTDAHGKFSGNEYIICERPTLNTPSSENPTTAETSTDDDRTAETDDTARSPESSSLSASSLEEPLSENPTTENPLWENTSSEITLSGNPTQLNTNKQNKDLQNTDISFDSFYSYAATEERSEAVTVEEYENYRDQILANIEHDALVCQFPDDAELIDEIVELITETVCAKRETIRVAGENVSCELVKSKLLKLDCEHIRFVLHCLKTNTTKILNIKQYLLTTLFNAPSTINSYYTTRCNHDMHIAEIDR